MNYTDSYMYGNCIYLFFFLVQGKKGKRFIDKRRDVLHTFKVVARSQRDPLVADETAPQAVLHPTAQVNIEVADETAPQAVLLTR